MVFASRQRLALPLNFKWKHELSFVVLGLGTTAYERNHECEQYARNTDRMQFCFHNSPPTLRFVTVASPYPPRTLGENSYCSDSLTVLPYLLKCNSGLNWLTR